MSTLARCRAGRKGRVTKQPPHARSQRQPVVRIHPVTGKPALYICEWGQMDWHDGPFVGMQPGPHAAGAALVDELMSHLTRPEFVYVHEWTVGDLVVWDNRCLVHAATWYDADNEQRMMSRPPCAAIRGRSTRARSGSWIREGEPVAAEQPSDKLPASPSDRGRPLSRDRDRRPVLG